MFSRAACSVVIGGSGPARSNICTTCSPKRRRDRSRWFSLEQGVWCQLFSEHILTLLGIGRFMFGHSN